MSETEIFLIIGALLFIAVQAWECSKALYKIYRLLIVHCGDEAFKKSLTFENK